MDQATGEVQAMQVETTQSRPGGAAIDEAAVRAHVMRPSHVVDMVSSRGLEEGAPTERMARPAVAAAAAAHFDVTAFGTALHAALKDCVAGYVMRLQGNNLSYTLEWNWAKTPADGSEGWSPGVRMHVASCSKLITGTAMTKLLNDKQISPSTPIINHLPTYWAKGPNIDKITFHDLMTHTSGFNSGTSNSDYAFMKAQVAAGVSDHGKYHYQNMNFGLCRILLTTIHGDVAPGTTFDVPSLPNSNDVVWDYVTIQSYVKYAQAHVFAPAGVGVNGPSLDHPAADALAYTFPVNGNGWNSGDLSTVSGGAGWHMAADELLHVMTALRSGAIMPKAQAQAMLDAGFGIDVIMSTPLGTLYNKNGLWGDGIGRVEQSLAYFLPQGVQLVVLANSPICSPPHFFRDLVTNIYLSSITA